MYHRRRIIRGVAALETILIVTSGAAHIELRSGRREPSGYYLGELVLPAQRFVDAGYAIELATPGGVTPAVDRRSMTASHFGGDPRKLQAAVRFVSDDPALRKPLSFDEASRRVNQYAAVFIPGGHAPTTDLAHDRRLGEILREFHRAGKPTAALCHGPVALLSTLPEAQAFRDALAADDRAAAKLAAVGWPYAGYRMTAFSTEEEKSVESGVFRDRVQFYVAEALEGAGGVIENARKFQPLVVEDRELVTGQNPASTHQLTEAVLKALSERSARTAA